MERRRATVATGVLIILVLAAAAPAMASLRHRRAEPLYSRQQPAAQGSPNPANALSAKAAAELARLTQAVQSQQARLDDALRAEAAATQQATRANQAMTDLEARSAAAKRQLISSAVYAYMRGGDTGDTTALLQADSASSDGVLRQTYLQLAQKRTVDAMHTLRAARQGRVAAQRDLDKARLLVSERHHVEHTPVQEQGDSLGRAPPTADPDSAGPTLCRNGQRRP